MQEVSDGYPVVVTDSQKGISVDENPQGSSHRGTAKHSTMTCSVAESVYISDYNMTERVPMPSSQATLRPDFRLNV
jgi:hypothetical protein